RNGMTGSVRYGPIGQILIPVKDVDRSVRFYRDILGFTFPFQVPGRGMAFFDCWGVRLFLGVPELGQEFSNGKPVYYRVESIDDAHADLKAKGADLI
ncbi:MAG: VOC family protein, partial [Chloroflexi bacterium]|nr:VOC family protein [Chloroflexota bacterium]